MRQPEILFDLHCGKKSETKSDILKDYFRKLQIRYKEYQQIYTDGSKEDSKISWAVISDNHCNIQRIPGGSYIFATEAKAVDLALDLIRTSDTNKNYSKNLIRFQYWKLWTMQVQRVHRFEIF